MLQKIKNSLLLLITPFIAITSLIVPAVVNAQSTPDIKGALCQGAQTQQFSSSNTTTCDTQTTEQSLNGTITNVINILSVIVGIVAVIMIIFGGFRYITSGGDSTKVGNAKNTILYALIGLIIVALAQIIVRFVLNKSTSVQSA